MGEKKRRDQKKSSVEKTIEDIEHRWANEGKIIEGGWEVLKILRLHPDSPPDQIKDLRWAFMAGAQHLFFTIMRTLDPGEEPTEADLKRFDLVAQELQKFYKYEAKPHWMNDLKTEGSA